MEKYFLGVDTSNYTTSLCICKNGEIIAERKKLLPVKNGEVGLRQSDALFHHTVALPDLCKSLFDEANIDRKKISAVGVSKIPRDIEGSYMPCFLAGVSFATAFSSALDVPQYYFSHQAGHIMAAAISGNASDILDKPFISFHVSGGTTEALLVSPLPDNLKCKIIGGTRDLNAGQAIDRCGISLGISFPCGKEMDLMSQKSSKKFSPKVSVSGGYFNISGLENQAQKMILAGEKPEDVCAYTFDFIAKTLNVSSENIRTEYSNLPILFAGGVLSNTRIRALLYNLSNVYFAKPEYSCDNAYGIALLAEYSYNNGWN